MNSLSEISDRVQSKTWIIELIELNVRIQISRITEPKGFSKI
jgi:hypothetical protein